MTESEQHYRSALALYQRKDFPAAIDQVRQAVAVDPKLINGWRLWADCCTAQGKLGEAVQHLYLARSRADSESRQWVSVTLHLCELLVRAGHHGDARSTLDEIAFIDIAHVEPLSRAAYLYSLCDAHRESLRLYESALTLQPENDQLLFNCAAANRAMGDMQRAEQLYDRLLALNPDDFEAFKNRSDLRRQTAEQNHIAELERCITRDGIPAAGASQLHFALAKEYEDLGQFEQSLSALNTACKLRRSLITYDASQEAHRLREIRAVFDAEYFQPRERNMPAALPDAGRGIIFVLGMPRTGTTLVDRLLCCGDRVFSAGEPGTFARLLMELVPRGESDTVARDAFVRRAAKVDFKELGRRYESELRSRVGGDSDTVIIDKNPMNFLYAGLIHQALPAAKIVHLRRHPADTCYAILKTQFRSAYPFSYDQCELAHYYLGYRELMEHWHRVMPGRIFDLHYEQLVQDLEEQSRRLFDFCDLPWNRDVLDFHQQEKQGTATASASQVRQPVYTSSIGKWRNYREGLQPMLEVLRAGGIVVD
ncbi:tetratricopeptide repeat-containing sulfotransferase family protein [Microbulbifer hainanensis]|uniref:tetratricopeptide repeat-containing sulfotransferase family protein n=1 Tax=Microbulbifer hainanensis TaxID=2735675 RepID=UPI0018695387|nr:sulfotransferase [Microbulbifer hainanensis]